MKTTRLIALLLVGVIISMSSCKKDKEENENVLEKSYFTVDNGSYVGSAMPSPSASGPSIGTVTGNSNVLAGGSNPISINTSSTVTDVIVGVQGQNGYFKIPTTSKSDKSVIMVVILLSQEATANFSIVIALANGTSVSTYYTIPVTVRTAGTGKLQVSLSWNKPNDVDLHLYEPNGSHIYYADRLSDNGGKLDVDSNPICYIDNINNENITYADTSIVENGLYTVKVDLYSGCEVTEPTSYVVTARYNGALITPVTGSNPYSGTLLVSDEDEDEYKIPMTFRIGTTKNTSKYYSFNFPDKKKSVLSPQKME